MNAAKKKYYDLAKELIEEYGYERSEYEDRQVLEGIIFPYLLSEYNPRKILDIGREDYQEFYNQFFAGRELWTIDLDPQRAEFGAENHIIDSAANLQKHFDNDYFDLVVMNGVVGWGLNKNEEIQKTFAAIYHILRPGGIFVFGFNDLEDLLPVPLERIKFLQKMKPVFLEPLKTDSFCCKGEGRHTYNFYTK